MNCKLYTGWIVGCGCVGLALADQNLIKQPKKAQDYKSNNKNMNNVTFMV